MRIVRKGFLQNNEGIVMPIGGKEAFLSKVTFRRESNWVSKTKQMLKDMKTIEERARDARRAINTSEEFGRGYSSGLEDGYIIGAHQQRTIDIDKACEWLRLYLPRVIENYPFNGRKVAMLNEDMREEFRKAMEEEL